MLFRSVPAAVAPSSYVAPAPSYQAAPAVQAPVAPVQYQVGTSYPQAVPQVAPNYQSAPTQYAPQYQSAEAPTSNPWESAFNKVVNLLSAPVQSPFQAQPSAPTSPYSPANYGQVSNPLTQQSAPQTWQANPTFSPNSSQTSGMLYGEEARQAHAEVNGAIAEYLDLSPESRFVLGAYGWEAPGILNNYALQLENMLDSAVAWGSQAKDLIQGYANFAVNEHQENLAYNEILTNPDVLSDYTLRFFGPEGPYPVYENEGELDRTGYRTEAVNPMLGQFPAPPAAAAPQQPENFWGSFKQQMDMDPSQAWRLLNQAQPQVVANKLFVME